ncbi:lectin beta-1 and beta-2 chains-like [Cryptomeria japonica]|uniref:lectin beta-1 and beta-2 chains-like n=1 Tax=Cryptomeria japonica TaxID=3369 RepID=UPI0025AD3CC4|nr:lectin beta-1 and beta-2 chains-like [Cryptomeria japonica]
MASLQRIHVARLFIFCISASNSFIHGTDAGAIAFHFPPKTNITGTGDASISENKIQFTKNQLNFALTSTLGWVIYNDFIPLWDNSSGSVANFSTHFQFIITKAYDRKAEGDGFTFFLSPSGLNISSSSPTQYLGLFRNKTDGSSSNQIVAVEFDTFQNDGFYPNDNHVGIDVNSIKSKKSVSLDGLFGRFPQHYSKNGRKWDAWVDYDINLLVLYIINLPLWIMIEMYVM